MIQLMANLFKKKKHHRARESGKTTSKNKNEQEKDSEKMSFMNEGEIDKKKSKRINQEQTSTKGGKVRKFFTVICNDMKTHIFGKEWKTSEMINIWISRKIHIFAFSPLFYVVTILI